KILFSHLFVATIFFSFYLVECSDRDKGPKYKPQPFCRKFCDGPGDCGPPCPNCKGNWWIPDKCQ
ncbi:secreted protein, putative, partial [Ixodes scapularis]